MSASLNIYEIEEIEAEAARRDQRAKAEKEAVRRLQAAEHTRECMEYDDAKDATGLPWRERRKRCKIGIHKTRWNPRWVRGTYGFCIHCGVSTGGGIGDGGY